MINEKTKAKQEKKEDKNLSDKSNKMAIVKTLLDKGKKSGTLTYKEIMDEIEHIELSTEQIEKIYEVLESMGIEVLGQVKSATPSEVIEEEEEEEEEI
ncbi:MAG: RNA polymerase sigma factor region1.1 domain-containing protein, partial [Clostridium sp.]